MTNLKISKPKDIVKRRVVLCGLTDIMFDRYAGDNNTKLETSQNWKRVEEWKLIQKQTRAKWAEINLRRMKQIHDSWEEQK